MSDLGKILPGWVGKHVPTRSIALDWDSESRSILGTSPGSSHPVSWRSSNVGRDESQSRLAPGLQTCQSSLLAAGLRPEAAALDRIRVQWVFRPRGPALGCGRKGAQEMWMLWGHNSGCLKKDMLLSDET